MLEVGLQRFSFGACNGCMYIPKGNSTLLVSHLLRFGFVERSELPMVWN